MKPNQQVTTSSFNDSFFHGGYVQQPFQGGGFPTYPGGGQEFGYPTVTNYPSAPAGGGGFLGGFGGGGGGGGLLGGGGGGGSGGGLGNFNLGQIKAIVDRMGGIEGVVANINKVQKIIGSIQQLSPMIKLLASSFGQKASTAKTDDSIPAKRKRRKTRKGTARKRLRRP